MSKLSPLAPFATEYNTLKSLVEAYRDRVQAASDKVTDAMGWAGIPTRFGVYQIEPKDYWRYPSVDAAVRVRDALRDDDGFFWAESRLRDLESLLGLGYKSQTLLPFEQTIPEAHPSVKTFLAQKGS